MTQLTRIPVLGGHLWRQLLLARVGGTDARLGTHRDDEEQPAVVGEEREHPPVRGDAVDEEVDALGVDVVVRGPHPACRVVLVGERCAWTMGQVGADEEHAARSEQADAIDPVAQRGIKLGREAQRGLHVQTPLALEAQVQSWGLELVALRR